MYVALLAAGFYMCSSSVETSSRALATIRVHGLARARACATIGRGLFPAKHPAILLKRVCCPTVDDQNPAPPFELPPATPIFNIDHN